MDAFCRSVTSELPTEQEDQKVDVALICEATSQLCGVNYHPMNRVLGFGAKYLQENYSKWISRNMHVGNVSISMTSGLITRTKTGWIFSHSAIFPLTGRSWRWIQRGSPVSWRDVLLTLQTSFSGAQSLYTREKGDFLVYQLGSSTFSSLGPPNNWGQKRGNVLLSRI